MEADEVKEADEIPFKGTLLWTEKYLVADPKRHPCTPVQRARFRRTFDRFGELAGTTPHAFENDELHPQAVIGPIEFIAIAFLVDRYRDRSNEDMERAIRTMRCQVRATHSDNVRRKQAVWNTLMQSIKDSLGGGASNGGQTKRSAEVSPADTDRSRRVRQRFGLE
jgi:hypothetical protein